MTSELNAAVKETADGHQMTSATKVLKSCWLKRKGLDFSVAWTQFGNAMEKDPELAELRCLTSPLRISRLLGPFSAPCLHHPDIQPRHGHAG